MRTTIAIFLLSTTGACDPDQPRVGACDPDTPDSDPYADCVEELVAVEDSDFGHDALPEIVLGPPGGTLDVASLGCGGAITLGFDEPAIVDGPGPDLIVFENPFAPEFPEPGRVSVSEDGEAWHVFDCDPVTLDGCAGVTPVAVTPGSGIEPTDPSRAGGDAFDLGALGLSHARLVRIEDVSAAHWAELGGDYCDPGQAGKGGFDLDAVAAVHGEG